MAVLLAGELAHWHSLTVLYSLHLSLYDTCINVTITDTLLPIPRLGLSKKQWKNRVSVLA